MMQSLNLALWQHIFQLYDTTKSRKYKLNTSAVKWLLWLAPSPHIWNMHQVQHELQQVNLTMSLALSVLHCGCSLLITKCPNNMDQMQRTSFLKAIYKVCLVKSQTDEPGQCKIQSANFISSASTDHGICKSKPNHVLYLKTLHNFTHTVCHIW